MNARSTQLARGGEGEGETQALGEGGDRTSSSIEVAQLPSSSPHLDAAAHQSESEFLKVSHNAMSYSTQEVTFRSSRAKGSSLARA